MKTVRPMNSVCVARGEGCVMVTSYSSVARKESVALMDTHIGPKY